MCGFVCLWKVGDPALARRMIDKITHRGPDGIEVKRAPNVPAVMAHCRLAIIGPDNGTQPLYGDDELLVANGEIYNHAELAGNSRRERFRDRERQRDHPAPFPLG